jgi:SAM-dependent methyltransferase
MLDETAHAGEEHLDPDYVQGYDRKAGTDPEEDLTILRRLGLNETHTLVDFGAGTGTIALAAAPLCRRVVAIDVSPPMLRMLEQHAQRLGLSNVESVRGGFLSYHHKGELADFVYSRNALHHLPDFWKALALQRMAAVLKPGGRLFLRDLVYSFNPGETEQVFAAWFAGAARTSDVGWTREEFEVHIRTEYGTFSWLLEPMIERAGFAIEEVAHAPARVYSAYTCVRRG